MKLLFCGDMAFTSSTGENEILNTEMVNLFREYDFKCVNFECTMKGDEIKKIGPSLLLNETMCEAIKKADFDLFCLANNHIMDQGISGLQRIKEYFSDTQMIGAGESIDDAYQPYILSKDNLMIGIINVAENGFGASINNGGYAWFGHSRFKKELHDLRRSVDYLILMVHAGAENWDAPLPEIRELYKDYIDMGVDVVIGNHPHVAQGWEKYNNKWIFYSLGNFAFYEGEKIENNRYSISAHVEITDNEITCKPVYCKFENGKVGICKDIDFLNYVDSCNEIINNNNNKYIKYINDKVRDSEMFIADCFSQVNGIYYKKSLINYAKTFVKRYIWKEKFNSMWLFHNLMIETHLWVAQRYLNLKVNYDETSENQDS